MTKWRQFPCGLIAARARMGPVHLVIWRSDGGYSWSAQIVSPHGTTDIMGRRRPRSEEQAKADAIRAVERWKESIR